MSRREKVKEEPLGKQVIEGVSAEGTRTVATIEAGAIGNDRPIQSVTERWFSPELQTVMLTRNSDPRIGRGSLQADQREPGRAGGVPLPGAGGIPDRRSEVAPIEPRCR